MINIQCYYGFIIYNFKIIYLNNSYISYRFNKFLAKLRL